MLPADPIHSNSFTAANYPTSSDMYAQLEHTTAKQDEKYNYRGSKNAAHGLSLGSNLSLLALLTLAEHGLSLGTQNTSTPFSAIRYIVVEL